LFLKVESIVALDNVCWAIALFYIAWTFFAALTIYIKVKTTINITLAIADPGSAAAGTVCFDISWKIKTRRTS